MLLEVGDEYSKDASVVTISSENASNLSVFRGDILKIHSKLQEDLVTVGICLIEDDGDNNYVQLSEEMCESLSVQPGDFVDVTLSNDFRYATEVIITPFITFNVESISDEQLENGVNAFFVEAYRPICEGFIILFYLCFCILS